jgi:cysteine desulfurase
MKDSMTYLDWAATALPEADIAQETARVAVEYPGNPSSRHGLGKRAAGLLAECRERCAAVLDVEPQRLVFTSGATEANNLIVLAELHRRSRGHLVTSDREHSSLQRPTEQLRRFGFDGTRVSSSTDGVVSANAIIDAIRDDTVFVATTLVESESGSVLDVPSVSSRIRTLNERRKRAIHHHCDCVQALGKIPLSLAELDVDTASFSAHKIGGPRGVGLLYCRRGVDPIVVGGGQERDIRPGTENLPAIYGMTLALERYVPSVDIDHGVVLCRAAIDAVFATEEGEIRPSARRDGPGDGSYGGFSPYIVQAAFPPVPGEVLARVLSDRGIAVSTGSACAANLTHGEQSASEHSVRLSFGRPSTLSDVERFASVLSGELSHLTKVLG